MGKQVISGWKKAAIYNPADGTSVLLSQLSTQFSAFDPENIQNETPTGQSYGGKVYPLVIGFMDSGGLAQLETWKTAHTPLRAVVYVPGGQHILFRQSEEFFDVLGGGVNARDGAAIHQVQTEVQGEAPDVPQKKNLAEAITFAGDAGELVFPIEGPTLTLAADYAAINSPTLSIEAQAFDGSVLATASQAVGSTGRESVEITLPAGTYKLAIDLVGAGSADVTNVSLRSDGQTDYITY